MEQTTINRTGNGSEHTVWARGQFVGHVARHATPEVKSRPWGFASTLDDAVVCVDGYKTAQEAADVMATILKGRHTI